MSKQPSLDTNDTGKAIAQELSLISKYLKAIAESNTRQEDLLKILAQPILQAVLNRLFKDSRQIHAYELSDGNRSTRDIGKIVGVDQKTVSNWWRAWETDYKIIEKAGTRGQFRKRYSLFELVVMYSPSASETSDITVKGE